MSQVKGYAQPALLAGAVIWCSAVFSAPVFHLYPLYSFFSSICHQLPDRSWHIHGEPLALCIRCTAISIGFFAGLLIFKEPDARRFTKAAAVTVLEWLLALAILDSEFLRVLSGILLGATAAPIIRTGVNELFTRRVRTAHDPM
jgi:uncharacterized membrane protein